MRFLLFLLLLASSILAPAQTPSDPPLPTGKLIPRVVCARRPAFSYALYLPAAYTPSRPWPIVYSFDPIARGAVALESQIAAAERYGYLLVASNDSRNGPWQPQLDAAEAVVEDSQRRFSVDLRRVYFAGFSGGARVAAALALSCRCAAGVLLSGAGFPSDAPPTAELSVSVFSAVGLYDFNYPELIHLQDALESSKTPHWLRVFDGGHEWAPPPVMDEAFAWFQVRAILANLAPRDDAFLSAQFTAASARADALQSSGNPLAAFRDLAQICATYRSLPLSSPACELAQSLANDKSVRNALKQERSDFDEQQRLTADLMRSAALPPDAQASSETPLPADRRIPAMLATSRSAKPSSELRIVRRVLSGVYVSSIELGAAKLDAKNFDAARSAFLLAAAVNPTSEWPWFQLARVNALAGSRKSSLHALRQAIGLSANPAALREHVLSDPVFAALRDLPEFRQLVQVK